MNNPSFFLSDNGISYDGSDLKGTPEQIVADLILLNSTRTWDDDTQDFAYNSYATPGFTQAPSNNPNAFDPRQIAQEAKAVAAVYAAVQTGDPAKVYAAVDKVNADRQSVGGIMYQPPSDFAIYAHSPASVGVTARQLLTDQQQDPGPKQNAGQWFFSKEGFDAIAAQAAS